MTHVNNYNWNELNNLTEIVSDGKKHSTRYYNYPFGFDTETSSFKINNEKYACMYLWIFSINGTVIYGRTWSEFEWFIEELRIRLKLDYYTRIIVYVHNLSYDFQFMIGHMKFTEMFARKQHHPMKVLANECIELRCSYILSGLSLEKTAENLTSIKIEKKVGDLDYNLIRHWKTKLSDKELEYGEYDALIIHHFIKEEIRKNGDITKIPLTKTGYVRRYCRDYIKKHTNYKYYRERILKEAPIDEELFCLLNKAFAGGYTHANCEYIFLLLKDVYSIDFTSSYPAQMLAHKYPRGKFHKCDIYTRDEFYDLIENFACVFEIKLKNVKAKTRHHIWSSSKCAYGTNDKFHAIIDNGRLVESDEIYTYMTDVDFKTFKKFYYFDEEIAINNFWYTTYDYLPKPIIECCLKFYGDKTLLKDVEGKEEEYQVGKGMLNGIYGMMVTNPLNDEITFDDENWDKEEVNIQEALEKSYNSPNQFLCYQWGVWITAWARYELLDNLIKINDDAIYCDTDSIKFVNLQRHKKTIENYNIYITNLINNCLQHYDIDIKLANPDGKHPLGEWTYEGKYDYFKTLGAKRYVTQKDNKFKITISGLYNGNNKKKDKGYNPTNYILKHGGFDFVTLDMKIPPDYSYRKTHTYVDDRPYRIKLKDYNNEEAVVSEYRYIHLENSEFNLSMSEDFIDYLIGVDDENFATEREKRPELQIVKLQLQTGERKRKKRRKLYG